MKSRKPYNYCNLRKIIYHQYLPMLIGISDQMGAETDRLRCEVCQNLILSPMNTGLLRYAVATAPTVYGIETLLVVYYSSKALWKLQQHLPFTVLKLPLSSVKDNFLYFCVATAPTVYGIETAYKTWVFLRASKLQQHLPFTVLKP